MVMAPTLSEILGTEDFGTGSEADEPGSEIEDLVVEEAPPGETMAVTVQETAPAADDVTASSQALTLLERSVGIQSQDPNAQRLQMTLIRLTLEADRDRAAAEARAVVLQEERARDRQLALAQTQAQETSRVRIEEITSRGSVIKTVASYTVRAGLLGVTGYSLYQSPDVTRTLIALGTLGAMARGGTAGVLATGAGAALAAGHETSQLYNAIPTWDAVKVWVGF